MQLPYGTLLKHVTIDGIDIDVHSNGCTTHCSDEKLFDDQGHYIGIGYQCVEFVRRFIHLKHGVNLAKHWSDGDAQHWFDARGEMGLIHVPLSEARCGDIFTALGGKWGHVSIISKTDDHHIYTTNQNFQNNQDDIDYQLTRRALRKKIPFPDANGAQYIFQSILRYE